MDGAADGRQRVIMKTKQPLLSLIIPVYNERARLISGISKVLVYLKRQSYSWELIIVDDGSEIPVKKFLKNSFPLTIYRLQKNSGKGAAIRYGVTKAKGKFIVFSDIDLSVSIDFLTQMLRELQHHPVVIASRRLPESRIVVHQPYIREFSGRIFTAVSNILCNTAVADVTCGFKGYHRDTAQLLFGKSRINRWVFDTELVFLARKFGISVFEMPVDWKNKAGSKVKPWDSILSIIEVIKIRLYDMRSV